MNTKIVHIAGIAFAIIFGFSFMFSKIALDHVTPMGLLAYRFLIAFFVFEALRRSGMVKVKLTKSSFKTLLIVALFQPLLYFLFEIYGLQRIRSSEAGMMIALIPIFVSIFSVVFLKEKPKLIQVVFIILSISGIIFIQLSKPEQLAGEMLGFILLLGAVLSAAAYNIASRHASKSLKAHELTYAMMAVGAVVFNIFYIIMLIVEGRPSDYFTNLMQVDIILPILYLGTMASIVAFFLVNFVLSRLEAHVSSIYANLVTVVAIVAGAVFLGESLAYYHYIGSAMIIIGVYGTVSFNRGIRRYK